MQLSALVLVSGALVVPSIISSSDLLDLSSEVCFYAKAERAVHASQALIYLFRMWEKLFCETKTLFSCGLWWYRLLRCRHYILYFCSFSSVESRWDCTVICPVECSPYVTLLSHLLSLSYLWLIFLVSLRLYLILPSPRPPTPREEMPKASCLG